MSGGTRGFGNDLFAAAVAEAGAEPNCSDDDKPKHPAAVVPPLAMHKVHAQQALPSSRQGFRNLDSRGSSRPFLTSANWPEHRSMKAHTARAGAMSSAPSSEFSKMKPLQTERSFATRISNTSHGARLRTPGALYTNQFFTDVAEEDARGMRSHPSQQSADMFIGPMKTRRGGNRDWQRLVVRMPGTTEPSEPAEMLILGEGIRTVLGNRSTLHVQDPPTQGGNFTEMLMVEKPTSRKQAELLSFWFQEQAQVLMSLAVPTPYDLREAGLLAEPPQRKTPRGDEAANSAAWQSISDPQVARRLLAYWGQAGIPGHVFLHNCGHQINIEGITLPNDTRYTRALQHISCMAAAAVIHQVSMHCHERGKLLAKVWNCQSTMMEMQLWQANFQVQVLANEKQRLLLQLQNAGLQLASASDKDLEIQELRVKLKTKKGDLAIKDAELVKLNTEVAELKALVLQWNGLHYEPKELEKLQDELIEAKSELEEAERTRDVALTALFAGVQQSAEVSKQVNSIKKEVGSKLTNRDMEELDGMFKQMETGMKNIAAMETMVENKMNVERGSMLASGQANFLQVMKAKHMAKKLGGLARSRLLKKAASVKPEAVDEAAEAEKALETLKSFEPKKEGESLAPPDKSMELEHVVESAGVTSIPEIMLEADMIDVEMMDSRAMFREIQRLRERENTLLYAMQQMMVDKQAMDDYLAGLGNDTGPQVITVVETGKKGKKKKTIKATAAQQAPPQQAITKEAVADIMGPGIPQAPGGMVFNPGAVSDKKKDTILMMMRAVVASREEEVKLKKERAMRQNKAMSQMAAKAGKIANDECSEKLQQAQAKIKDLLVNSRDMHEEYTKVWNVLIASGIDTGNLVPAHLLVLPKELANRSLDAKAMAEAIAKKSEPSTETKKLGVAEKARKLMAQERVAKMSTFGKNAKAINKRRTSGADQQGESTTDQQGETIPKQDKPKFGSMLKSAAGAQLRSGSSIGMLQNISKQAIAAKHVAFACKDTSLREAIVKNKNVKPRAKEWLMKLMDQVYKSKTAQDAKLKRDEEELVAMPTYLFAHLQAQYGAKSLVQEYAACVVATTRTFAAEDIRCSTFGKFVSQEWDTPVLRVHLEAMERTFAPAGSLGLACCEFPDSYVPSRGMPAWICTWKAVEISEMFLGRRSDKCTEGFAALLKNHGCPVEPSEKAKFFWSPLLAANASDGEREAAAAQEEAARGEAMSKLSSARFLACLCEEYVRLEVVLDDAVPGLFKEHDADFSGYLDRSEIILMLQSLHGPHYDEKEAAKVWDIAENLERIQAEESGHDPPEGEVGVEAFSGAVKRTDAVRRYIRLFKSPPPPPELAAEHRESQSKMLYMVIERHWRSFEDAVKRILDSGALESAESNVRGQVTKVTTEKDGVLRAQMFVTLLKTLCDFMLVKIQRQCNPSVLSSEFDPMMETNLERVEKSVKVLFGWKTLLEDDRKNASALEDPNAGLIARQKAMKDWMEQSKAFVNYKNQMQKQAAAILQKKFYKRWKRTTKPATAEEEAEDAVPVSHILQLLKNKD